MPKPVSRITGYRRLVRRRKADFTLAKYNLINPSETKYDSAHLGSYAQWAGDLHADVLVVIPDFRCADQFVADLGRPVLIATPADAPQMETGGQCFSASIAAHRRVNSRKP